METAGFAAKLVERRFRSSIGDQWQDRGFASHLSQLSFLSDLRSRKLAVRYRYFPRSILFSSPLWAYVFPSPESLDWFVTRPDEVPNATSEIAWLGKF